MQSPRCPQAVRRRLPCEASLLGIALCAALLGVPTPARADCQPDPASSGDAVLCTALDADGFAAGAGVVDLTVDVERGAEVRDAAPGGAALDLNRGNTVTVAPSALVEPMPGDPPVEEAGGAITAAGAGSRGIRGGDVNSVTHEGVFTVSGAGAVGIDVGSRNTIEIRDTSPEETAAEAFDVTGPGAMGIRADDANQVTNRGRMEVAGDDAIGITADANNTLTNRGTLEVSGLRAVGIDVTGPGNDVDNVVDASLIVSGDDAIGIRLPDDGENLFSRGEIQVTGSGATGLVGGNDIGSLNPFNPLAGIGNLSGGGIRVTGAGASGIAIGDDGLVLNDGEIVVGSPTEGEGATGIRINARSGAFTTPDASIVVDGMDAAGVRMIGAENDVRILLDSSVAASGVNASGILGAGGNTVTIEGEVSATGTNSVGVDLAGAPVDLENTVTVSGTLSASDVAAAALRITGAGVGESLLTVEASGLLDAADSIAVEGSDGVEGITNRGVIRGPVMLGGGNDRFRQEEAGVLEGSLDGGTGSDALELMGGDLDLTRASGFETLTVLGAGQVSTIRGSAAFADGTEVEADSALRAEGTPTLTGAYSQRAGAELRVQVFQTGGMLDGDRLVVDGVATLEDGAILDVEVLGSGLLPTGVVTVIESSSDIQIGGGEGVSVQGLPTSAVLSFASGLDASGREFQLAVTRSGYAGFASGNAARMGAYLDGLLAGAGGELAALLTRLDALDAGALAEGLAGLQPEAYDALTSTALAAGLEFTRTLHGRPLACGTLPVPGLPEMSTRSSCGERGLTPWFDLSGMLAQRDGGSSHLDFDHAGALTAFGIDARPAEGWLVSGAVGGSYNRVEPDQARGRVASIDVGAAVAAELGPLLVRGAASYGRGFHRLDRRVRIGAAVLGAEGDYESDRATLLGSVAWPLDAWDWTLAPELQVDYAHLWEGAVPEDGGSPSLDVKVRDNGVLGVGGLVRLSRSLLWIGPLSRIPQWWHGTFTPSLQLGVRGVPTGADRDLEARLRRAGPGSSVKVQAEDAAWLVRAALGLGFQPWAYAASVSGLYSIDVGDGSMLHRLDLQVSVPF